MKKHLIAAAVATAIAVPAAAQVTVYGVLSSGYGSVETKVTDGTDTLSRKESSFGAQGLQSGSRLGFRGTEDIGGGVKAGFVYELRADLNTGASDSASGTSNTRSNSTRQGFVSLAGGFGELRFGRGNSTSKDVYDTFHAHGGSGFAPGNQSAALSAMYIYANDGSITDYDGDIAGYGNVRHSNIVTYITPTFSGFRVTAQYGKDKTDNNGTAANSAWPDADVSVSNIGLNYSMGALSVGIAMDSVKTAGVDTNIFDGTSLKDTTNILGVAYTMGPAKLFYTHTRHKDELSTTSDIKVEDNSVGAHYTMGAITLVGSYSDGEVKSTGLTITEDASTKGYQLGANYALSKRTMLLARVGESEAKVSGLKTTIDGFGIGVQHSF